MRIFASFRVGKGFSNRRSRSLLTPSRRGARWYRTAYSRATWPPLRGTQRTA